MKKKIILFVLPILILLFIGIYFTIDKKLYFYGRNTFDIYHELPLGINPNYESWRYDKPFSFIYKDNGIEDYLLSNEFTFSSDIYDCNGAIQTSKKEISITNIISYLFNKDQLIVLIENNKEKYYINYFERLYYKNDPKLSYYKKEVIIYDNNCFKKNNYRWVDLVNNNEYVVTLTQIQGFLTIVIIVVFIMFIIRFYNFFRKNIK